MNRRVFLKRASQVVAAAAVSPTFFDIGRSWSLHDQNWNGLIRVANVIFTGPTEGISIRYVKDYEIVPDKRPARIDVVHGDVAPWFEQSDLSMPDLLERQRWLNQRVSAVLERGRHG